MASAWYPLYSFPMLIVLKGVSVVAVATSDPLSYPTEKSCNSSHFIRLLEHLQMLRLLPTVVLFCLHCPQPPTNYLLPNIPRCFEALLQPQSLTWCFGLHALSQSPTFSASGPVERLLLRSSPETFRSAIALPGAPRHSRVAPTSHFLAASNSKVVRR